MTSHTDAQSFAQFSCNQQEKEWDTEKDQQIVQTPAFAAQAMLLDQQNRHLLRGYWRGNIAGSIPDLLTQSVPLTQSPGVSVHVQG